MKKSYLFVVLLSLVFGVISAEELSAVINGNAISIYDTKADIVKILGEPESIYSISKPGFIYMEKLEVLSYSGFELYFQNKESEQLVIIRIFETAENACVGDFIAGKTTEKEIDEKWASYDCYPERNGETYRFEAGKRASGGICLYTEKGLCKEIMIGIYPFLFHTF